MNKVKSSKKKSSIAFRLLYYWTKYLGINPLSVTKQGDLETTRIGIVYNCLLSTIYCYVFYETTNKRMLMQITTNEVPIRAIADYLGLLWQFFECLTTWFISGFFQRRLIVIIKSFVRIEKISEQLGNSCTYEIRWTEIVYNLMISNSVYFVTLILSNAAWSFMENYSLAVWILFYVPSLASFNATMLYILSFLIIKRKFHFLNEKLRDFVDNESRNYSRGSTGIASYDDDAPVNEIVMISQLHRELRNVVYRMEEYIGVPVLLDIGNNFTYMTLITYAFCRQLNSLEAWMIPSNFIFLTATGHWIMRPICTFLLISNVCGSTLDEANGTGNILHAFLNNCDVQETSPKYFMKLSVLSLDLLENKLNISLLGLLKLDHLFFYSMIATSISYLVIMLQFCH